MSFENCAIGRTKIVLAVEGEDFSSGVLAVLSVEIDNNAKNDVNFRGPGEFDSKTKDHIQTILIPLISKIITKLNIQSQPIVISLSNISAASVHDQRLYIKGFSADLPIFLAILSAYLNIPLCQDFVATGHICSDQGDLAIVEAIPGKIHGTLKYEEISKFVCPDPDIDQSTSIIDPQQAEDVKIAIARNKMKIQFNLIQSLKDLIGTVINNKDILYSALTSNFFKLCFDREVWQNPYSEFICKLTHNQEQRYWDCISESLFSKEINLSRDLISLRIQYQSTLNQYPSGFGVQFYNIVSSLPPSKRPKRIIDQFMSRRDIKNLSALADEENIDDFKFILNTISNYDPIPSEVVIKNPTSEDDYDQVLTFLLDELDEINLVKTITGPIDDARETFRPGKSHTTDYDEFLQIIKSFYIHLLRSTSIVSTPISDSIAGPAALSFLNRTLDSPRGIAIAWKQAKLGVNGGLRTLLDMMTEQYKKEKKQEHINYVLTDVLDPDNWPDLIKFGDAMKRYFKPILPKEMKELSSKEIALNYKNVILNVIGTVNSMKEYMRI